MDDRERQVLHILRDALDTEPDQRDQFLSQRCGDDTALRQRVSSLLQGVVGDELVSLRSEPRASGRHRPASQECLHDALIGNLLGPFRVLERVGRGGMGVVYRAVREGADFAQEVAIKLIRRGFDFDDVQARFLRERRILARLSHPNLAHFIDGGLSAEGRPWFALEFVRGVTITRWCDHNSLGVRDRVRLFVDVCAAVQYAHTQLVVHRDLKPGNVLVDDSGTVRLLDFGLAHLLSGDGDDRAASTLGLRHALTPEYAAPEQFAGGDVGVAADVYALGVILHELLAGGLPYVLDRHDFDAASRTVRDTPPTPLANAVMRGGDADELAARLSARSTSLRGFRNSVRGDLSRIVAKALAKAPSQRYSSVQSFADDLSGWLRGDPVRVSGNGLGYRLRKAVERNRVAVSLAAIALITLAAFASFHVVRLDRELVQTELQRNRAQASLDVLQNLLSSPDPQTQFGPTTNLGEFLAESAKVIGSSSHIDADVRDEIAVTIASSLRGLEKMDEALALLQPIASRPATSPSAARNQVAALTEIGQIQTLQGDYEPALATLQRAQQSADASSANDALLIASLLSMQSIANNHLGNWAASIAQIDRAVAVAEPISERQPAFYANLLGFASIPRAYPKADLPAAEALLRRSLAFQESHGLTESGLYPNTRGELAQVLTDAGRFEEVEPMLLDVVAQLQQRYGDSHRETAFKQSNLSLLYLRWNRLEEARRWRDIATRNMTAAMGAQHPFLALSLIQSADVAFYAADATRAARDARSSVAIADAADIDEFTAKAELYEAHARCLQGDAGVLPMLQQRVAALGDKFDVRAFDVRLALARCLDHGGRQADAIAAIEPFAQALAANEPGVRRTDYLLPWIERIRRAAAAP